MTEYGQTRTILKKYSLAPKKRFGQNFLVSKQTAETIVRAGNITDADTVLEVGVGLGALTHPLARSAQWVFGFEIDNGIIR
ncbi:MAG: ribosomal RNA small subunit methyltransferase A, partial [Deltaproteobacteria bacterium]|nr:ribosomal RNA small subunit methyltransferase A [Deltaproteobacteria bacterium]